MTSTASGVPALKPGEPVEDAPEEELKQVTIEVDPETDRLTAPILRGRTALTKMVSCRPHGEHGMMEFVELVSNVPIMSSIEAIRADPNTESLNYHIIDKYRASCIIVTRNSPVCSALSSTGAFCKTCALESDRPPGTRAKWDVSFSGENSLNRFMGVTKSAGIVAVTQEVVEPKRSRLLTFEQEEVVRTAEEGGYFEFPRRISLKVLSEVLSKSPSTLEEVLRRGESKIIANHVMHRKKKHAEPARAEQESKTEAANPTPEG